MPRFLLPLLLLSGGFASPALVPVALAAATPGTFDGPGLVELLRPTDVIGDGATAVELYVLALGTDGAPVTGLKVKMDAKGGTVTDLVDKGAGLYSFTFLPEKVDAASNATIELKGRLPSKEMVSRTWTVPVAPPRTHPMTVAVNPAQLTLGVDKTASLAFTVTGADPAVLAGVKLTTNVTAGTVTNLTHLGNGQFNGLYTAPASTKAQVALVTAVDAGDPTRTYAGAAIPLTAKVDQTVTVAPGTRVILKVGGREFGPVNADSRGKAIVPIVVPPGTTTATRVQINKDGSVAEAPLDLVIPEARRIALFAPAASLPSDARVQVPVRSMVVTPDGKPDEGAQVEFTSTAGSFGPARHEGGGVYAATFTPPTGNATVQATISVKITGGTAVQADKRVVTLVPVRASRVALSTTPPVLPATATALTVKAKVTGPDGAGLAGRTLTFTANGAKLAAVKDLKNGDYEASFTTTGKGPVEVGATVAGVATGNPIARVLMIPQKERLVADGLSSSMLTIVTLDDLGCPVPNVDVSLRLVGGDGSVPEAAKTNANGIVQVYYTAGRKNGMVGIEAVARDHVAGVSIVQAPASVPLPDLPVTGSVSTGAEVGDIAGSIGALWVERE